MKVLIVVALLASVRASSFPNFGEKCNIASSIFWRSPDNNNPNTYFYCNNKVVDLGLCPAGTGFLKTGDQNCTAFSSWKCLTFDLVLSCKNNQPEYMRAVPNPNLFSICRGDTAAVAPCALNYGFATGPKASGCMPWNAWNGVTNCFESS
ncbi:hypothetical protein ACFFRR_006082 [Megaselia abdita]